jgi:uncharacterized protein YcnI
MNVSRLAAASAVAAASVMMFSGAASAHVGVQPQGEAAKGGYAVVNVKVPNERDNASTIKVEINLPSEHPLSSVMPQPVPGWKAKVDKSTLDKPLEVHGKKITEAVTKVTWTADGTKIGPGEFQQFPLSLGRLPEDTDQLVFKAIQTYDNKEVVRWIEEPTEDGEEPEAPAPVLKLSAAADDHHGAAATGASAKDDAKAPGHQEEAQSPAASGTGSDSTARILGVVGILVGAAGVAFGVLAGRRRSA